MQVDYLNSPSTMLTLNCYIEMHRMIKDDVHLEYDKSLEMLEAFVNIWEKKFSPTG